MFDLSFPVQSRESPGPRRPPPTRRAPTCPGWRETGHPDETARGFGPRPPPQASSRSRAGTRRLPRAHSAEGLQSPLPRYFSRPLPFALERGLRRSRPFGLGLGLGRARGRQRAGGAGGRRRRQTRARALPEVLGRSAGTRPSAAAEAEGLVPKVRPGLPVEGGERPSQPLLGGGDR